MVECARSMIQLSPYFLAKELAPEISHIAEDAGDAICLTTPDGRLEWCNRSFSTLFGYTFEEAAGRRPIQLLAGADSVEEDLADVGYNMICEQDCCKQLLFYSKSDARLWISLRVSPSYDAEGYLAHFVWVMRDDSETMALAQENEKLRKLLATFAKKQTPDS